MATFLTELLKQYGFWTTVFTVVVLYALKTIFDRVSAKWIESRNSVPLKDHPAFKEFDRIINHSLVNEFTCSCPIRKALYRDILMERMRCFKARLLDFVETDLDDKRLYPTQHDFFLKVTSIIEDANIEAKRNSIASGVPEFVFDRLETNRVSINTVLKDMLKVVCHAEYIHASNTDRMRSVLHTIVVFCKNYMDMLEETLDSYNGDISNLNYNGIACKNCRVCIHDEYVRRMKNALK